MNLLELDLSYCELDSRIASRLLFKSIESIWLVNVTFRDNANFNELFMNKFGSELKQIDLSLNKFEFLFPNQFFTNATNLGPVK